MNFDTIFSIQLTVGVLSQRVPRGACLMLGAWSKITPIAKTAAANSRSELVMLPWGFLKLTNLEVTVAGKRERHSTGVVVEHDMEFIRNLQAPVTVLHEGSVLAEGSLDHVTKNPQVIEVYLGR